MDNSQKLYVLLRVWFDNDDIMIDDSFVAVSQDIERLLREAEKQVEQNSKKMWTNGQPVWKDKEVHVEENLASTIDTNTPRNFKMVVYKDPFPSCFSETHALRYLIKQIECLS